MQERSMSGTDLDRLERLLERRGELLDAATSMLVGVSVIGRIFDAREQDAWDYATAKADELEAEIDRLISYLTKRRQYPRAEYWVDA
jgi:dTDP-4-amino-4,6-dideoxygalactose transaminase